MTPRNCIVLFLLLIVHSPFTVAQKINTKVEIDLESTGDSAKPEDHTIEVIELRNYLIRAGQRDEFITYFEDNFIHSQTVLGASMLGQYRVKDADDNFLWIRGFSNMAQRSKFLKDFYFGPFWKAHKMVPNSLLLNNDNVHLLKPLNLEGENYRGSVNFKTTWFGKEKGISVIDFYISNTKLDRLIGFVKKHYVSILKDAGVEVTSFWTSEPKPNDFTALPVFQDKNLLVQITFYKDEIEYQNKMKLVDSSLTKDQKDEMADLITLRNTVIIYPTKRSY